MMDSLVICFKSLILPKAIPFLVFVSITGYASTSFRSSPLTFMIISNNKLKVDRYAEVFKPNHFSAIQSLVLSYSAYFNNYILSLKANKDDKNSIKILHPSKICLCRFQLISTYCITVTLLSYTSFCYNMSGQHSRFYNDISNFEAFFSA